MSDEYNDQALPEDMLDILHEEEFEAPHAAKPRGTSAEELPQPIYRLKTLHSSETFHAYYAPSDESAHFMKQCDLEGALAGPRPALDAASSSAEPTDQVSSEASAAAGDFVIPARSLAIAPTKYGRDLVEVLGVVRELSAVNADELVLIERPATVDDYRRYLDNLEREKEAFIKCRERIEAHSLPMKLVSAHCLLDDSKILFFFTAESRVDFRELVKDLVSVFHTRIELRQIGVRDEARVTGGCGVCGRILCCHGLSDKLNPVSIKMAKDQNLSLNSLKISGPCGRLLCCLSYEHQFYRDARRELPNEGTRFTYDGTLFKVIEVNVLSSRIRIAGEDGRILDMNAARLKYSDGRWTVIEEES
ncbi:MAG: regulatory iron-sulfur-containing complex subunit RicT [Rectinema sp.]|jgi:cell fate regulator YaaT (PSP1 superfamily)